MRSPINFINWNTFCYSTHSNAPAFQGIMILPILLSRVVLQLTSFPIQILAQIFHFGIFGSPVFLNAIFSYISNHFFSTIFSLNLWVIFPKLRNKWMAFSCTGTTDRLLLSSPTLNPFNFRIPVWSQANPLLSSCSLTHSLHGAESFLSS